MRSPTILSTRANSLKRVAVVGTSCSGKTTLARNLALCLGCAHFELDQLNFLSDWRVRPLPELRHMVQAVADTDRWIIDGNYGKLRDIVWARASHVVWLNLPFGVVFWRALRRTARRVISQEELFGGNTETFRRALINPESIPWWVVRTHRRRRREYRRLLAPHQGAHPIPIEIKSPADADAFLERVCCQMDVEVQVEGPPTQTQRDSTV